MSKKQQASFFQRTGKYIILFVTLGIVAMILTAVTVTVGHYYGNDLEVGAGIYFNFNVFITLMMGFLVTPIVILFVTKQREKVMNKTMSNKAMTQKQKRISAFIGIAALGAFLLMFFVVIPGASSMQQQRLVKSSIGTNEILALRTDYGTGNMMGVPFSGAGWLFYQLDIDNEELAQEVMLPYVVLTNGSHCVIEFSKAFTSGSNAMDGTTFAFFYLEHWWIHDFAIPAGYDPDVNATRSEIMKIAQ